MFKRGVSLVLLFVLCACGHNLYMVGRTSGATTETQVVTTPGQHSGDISFVLKGKTYTGRWVHMTNGGTVGFGSAVAVSGNKTAVISGTGVNASMQGNGTILASAPDGSSLRCVFDYNDWSQSGVGVCQDKKGEVYDMQIN